MLNDAVCPNGNECVVQNAVQLGEKARQKRKLDGLTQQELAAVAGVGVRFISDLEKGKPTIQLNCVFAVFAALGLQLTVTEK